MDLDGHVCRECGAQMIPGNIALPILGVPKFAYRMKMVCIETEIDGSMCEACGNVIFIARDPERIRKAHAAVRRAGVRR